MFVADKIGYIKNSDKSIEKYGKLLKTRKLSKLENLKGKKLLKSPKIS